MLKSSRELRRVSLTGSAIQHCTDVFIVAIWRFQNSTELELDTKQKVLTTPLLFRLLQKPWSMEEHKISGSSNEDATPSEDSKPKILRLQMFSRNLPHYPTQAHISWSATYTVQAATRPCKRATLLTTKIGTKLLTRLCERTKEERISLKRNTENQTAYHLSEISKLDQRHCKCLRVSNAHQPLQNRELCDHGR